jgi:hypothetical protein
MGTFSSVLSELTAGVVNSHPSTSSLMAAAMVRQLQNLLPETIPFMEITGSFNTVANQAAYTATQCGAPSLLRFDRLWYDLGQYARPLVISDPNSIRQLQEMPSIDYPLRVCWLDEKLQFGPAPVAIRTVKWDAVLDATKDTATGALITTSSTTQTNGWLTEGVVPFRHLVWADYFLTSPDQRSDLAANHSQLAATAMNRLRTAYAKRQELNATPRTPNAFDQQLGDAGLRIATLFPGAPV